MTDAASSRYVMYRGPYHRAGRLVGLAVLTAAVASSHPSPSLDGHGLIVLVALVLAVATQAASVMVPGRLVRPRTLLVAVSAGVLAGYAPGVATAFVLALAGVDIGASLELGPGLVTVALAVVADLLATLAGSDHLADAFLAWAVVAGLLLATTTRQYELRVQEAELRLADAERAEQERARAARLAERAHAARELHDILAHNLGALAVQMDTVNAIMAGADPDLDVLRPLLAEAHGRAVDGLVEARNAVRGLRADEVAAATTVEDIVPPGHQAEVATVGPPRPVDVETAAVLRRTAQEAITNTTKHAPGATPHVRLEYLPDALVLTVTDTGGAPGARRSTLVGTGAGLGLLGMRERADLIGATLAAGPCGTGWRVELTVPDRGPRR